MKKDMLFECGNNHRFLVKGRDMKFSDGLGCIECGDWCTPIGYAENYDVEGLSTYSRKNKKPIFITGLNVLNERYMLGVDLAKGKSITFEREVVEGESVDGWKTFKYKEGDE